MSDLCRHHLSPYCACVLTAATVVVLPTTSSSLWFSNTPYIDFLTVTLSTLLSGYHRDNGYSPPHSHVSIQGLNPCTTHVYTQMSGHEGKHTESIHAHTYTLTYNTYVHFPWPKRQLSCYVHVPWGHEQSIGVERCSKTLPQTVICPLLRCSAGFPPSILLFRPILSTSSSVR